ncbi:hypothetical protein BDF22DRAFT_327138 [Syncephalis plumigaleata]|nr:hypothetical protein BDF22DRAFT_327138 [Syncephalis plumigaleata]
MVGDDLTSEVSLDKPGTGYFLSTLDGKSRGNIVYEVVTAQDHANGVTYPQKDRHFLVVSWQVNPSKPKPSQEQIVEEDGDHRYKLAAMVVKADSPGFPLRGFSQKQFFDTIANHVLAGDTQEWTYPLRDGVSFNLVASIKGRDSHMEEYTNGEMFGKYQSAARKYAESPEAFDKQPITLLATEHNVNVGPGHDSAQLLAKAVSASRTSAAAAPPSSPDTNDDGYLEPAVLDIFVTLPGPPKTSKFKDIYTGYMLYAPASGFYWKNHEALLDINRVIENRLTLKDEEPLMLVEHNENSVMQLRRIYETPLSGRRIMSIRPGDRAVMLPLRYDLYDLILKPGKTCRRIYAVEELHATTLVSKHRQYVVNSFLIGRAGASVVYGMMDTADAPDDGAAITRFLDIVRVDLLALPGGLFEYSAPLLHRGQIYVKHFLSFGGPNVASTNISTCRPHIDAENNNLSMEGSGYGSKTTLRIQFLNIHPQVKVASTSVLSLSCRCLPSGIVHKELSENQETFTVDIANVVTHAAEGFAACLQIKLAEANGDSDLQAIEVYIYKVASSDADKPIYVARSLLRTKKSCAADKEQHVEVPDVIPAEEQIDGQNNYKEHCVDSDSSEDEDEDEDGDVSMSLVDKTKKRERTSIPRIVRPRPDDNDVLTETCILNTANLARSTRGLDSLGEGYISGCNRCFVGTRLGYNENDGITTLLAVAASLPNVVSNHAVDTSYMCVRVTDQV